MPTRRDFLKSVLLKSGGLALFSLGVGPRFLSRLALAAPPSAGGRPKTLVSIFLRGAMDGLMAVPTLDEERLRQLRPRLVMSAARSAAAPLLDLDGRFGLHPGFAPLEPFFREGRLAVVHGVGSPNPTRSHFDAQDYMETGTPWRKSTPSGWLNRVVGEVGAGASPFGAVAMTPELPRSLYGDEPALAIADLADFQLLVPRNPELAATLDAGLEQLYELDAKGLVKRRGQEMFEALRRLSQAELAAYRRERAALYPDTPLGRSLMQIAYLIRSGVGLQVACAELGGWDTHVGQGTERGPFASRAQELAAALAAFWRDVEPFHDDVVVLTMTEFGRTVRENGSGGTDHGHGSCLFVLGNRVDGGKVYGEVPELDPDALFEGRDLPVAVDFRAVFAEVAGKLFRLTDDARLFPGWEGQRLPVLW